MKRLGKLVIVFLFLAGALLSWHGSSRASFSQNHIMDDQIFDNYNSMNESQIQSFIASKGPCLVNYQTPNPHLSWDANNNAVWTYGPDNVSASHVIYFAAQQWGLNPQVILTTLEKEESLVAGSSCDSWRYNAAMGYACPDSGGCNPKYAGLTRQILWGSWQLKYNKERSLGHTSWDGDDNLTYSGYMTQGTLKRCGSCQAAYYDGYATIDSTQVHMDTGTTASLYSYTPHFHGNQNFVTIFESWFGSTLAVLTDSIQLHTITPPDPNPAVGETITYSVSFTNTLSSSITFDAVGIVGRLGSLSGANRDFGWQGPVTLSAGATQQFTFTTLVTDAGTIYAWPAIYYNGGYIQYNNWGTTMVSHTPNFTLSQPLSINATTVYAGQNVTFSATLKNNESHSISYGAIGIPVKFYDSYSYDAVWVGPGTVGAGAEVALSGVRNIDKPGPYSYWVSDYFNARYSTIGGAKKLTALGVTPNFSVSGLSFSNPTPVVGEDLGASFTVTNNLPVPIDVDAVGVVGRYATFSGANRDLGWQGPVHFNAGEAKSFAGLSRNLTEVGTHYYWIGILYKGAYSQYNNWGSTIISRAPNFSVSGLTFTDTSPAQGDTLGATFTVTNNLPGPIDVDAVGVVGRFGALNGPNRDLDWKGPVHFNAGETKSFTDYSGTITDVGTYYYWIGVYYNGGYLQYNNWGSTIVSHT